MDTKNKEIQKTTYTCPICRKKHGDKELCPMIAEIACDINYDEKSYILGGIFLECIKQEVDFIATFREVAYYMDFFRYIWIKSEPSPKFISADLLVSYFAKTLKCKVSKFYKNRSYLVKEYAKIINDLSVTDIFIVYSKDGSFHSIGLQLGSSCSELGQSWSTIRLHKSFDGDTYEYNLMCETSGLEPSIKINDQYNRYRYIAPGSLCDVTGFELCVDKNGELHDYFEKNCDWKEVACKNKCSATVFKGWIEKLISATERGHLMWTDNDADDSYTYYETNFGRSKISLYVVYKVSSSYKRDVILIKERENKMYYYANEQATEDNKEAMKEVKQAPEIRRLAEAIRKEKKKQEKNTYIKSNIERKLKRTDVVSVTYSFTCLQRNHSVVPYCGIVPILTPDNNYLEEKVYLGYCKTCDVFYMFYRDYNALKAKGDILCKVIDALTGKTLFDKNKQFSNEQSILSEYGYNVQASINLSDNERKAILDKIIDEDDMPIHFIINLLEMEIHLHKNKMNYANAVSKWKTDVEYLKNYGVLSGRERRLVKEKTDTVDK